MPINRPQRYTSQGLVWNITGTPYVRRTRIRLLQQNRFGIGLRRVAARDLVLTLRRRAPVRTGRLRLSIHNEGDAAILGPRIYRNPLTGDRPEQFYALPANVRSRRPYYIEKSIFAVSKAMIDYERNRGEVQGDLTELDNAFGIMLYRSYKSPAVAFLPDPNQPNWVFPPGWGSGRFNRP